ncbi:MAG: hypothetical protein WCI88_11275 [Chloroflexota bacterium]
MSPENQPIGDLATEFERLGQNIKQSLEVAWDSEERKRFQNDIEQGISGLSNAVTNFMNNISRSPTAQKVKSELEEIKNQAHVDEVQTKVRQDVISALKRANDEIEKSNQQWREEHSTAPEEKNISESD